MKAWQLGSRLRTLREQAHWRLLASDDAPWTIALLQTLLYESDRVVPVSVLIERLGRELEYIRLENPDLLVMPPQKYLSSWLNNGWLIRKLPPGAAEEEIELSLEAIQAIRYLWSLSNPRVSATESRLSTVIARARELAEKTDSNPDSRISSLKQQIHELEEEVTALESGKSLPMPHDVALEGVRDLLLLVDGIPEDFHRVRDSFISLNRELRQRLVEHEGSRAVVLEELFAGKDLIAESEAGKTFSAFWNILKNPELQQSFNLALESLLDRPFARALNREERQNLGDFFGRMLKGGLEVQQVHQGLSNSLQHFVQSNAYMENLTVGQMIKDALHQASQLRKLVPTACDTGFSLTLTTASISSVSQWQLWNPELRVRETSMHDAETLVLDATEAERLIKASEIRFEEIKDCIRSYLHKHEIGSIGDILQEFPANQGLASIAGYLMLANRYGVVSKIESGTLFDESKYQTVSWEIPIPNAHESWLVHARIPLCFFMRGCENEFDH